MCNPAAVAFARRVLTADDVAGRRVLEVGSITMDLRVGKEMLDEKELSDPTGSIRGALSILEPGEYVGLDLEAGPGVDVIGRVEHLVDQFGPRSFDLVIAAELLEHIADWRTAVRQLSAVGQTVLVTTRSCGFPFHRAPWDYWRFELDDARQIWPGALVESDPVAPGIFVLASEIGDLDDIALHSVLTGRRQLRVGRWDATWCRLRRPRLFAAWLIPKAVKDRFRRYLGTPGY